jgi:hypothetical protein
MSELYIQYRPDWTQAELSKLRDKWFVKKLSGELKGWATYYDCLEHAQIEANYLADHGVCPKVSQVNWYKGRLVI